MQQQMKQVRQSLACLVDQIEQLKEKQWRLQYKIDEVKSLHRSTRLRCLSPASSLGSLPGSSGSSVRGELGHWQVAQHARRFARDPAHKKVELLRGSGGYNRPCAHQTCM